MTEHGFANPSIEAASAFRAILEAMSRPGRILPFDPPVAPPPPLLPGVAAVALTLCDFQTPVWLAPALRSNDISYYLTFETSAPMTEALGEASFVFMPASQNIPHPSLFAQGSHEYPDRSATLVLQVAELNASGPLRLSGPGISGVLQFGVEGLGRSFWTALAENHAGFPVGIDVMFVSPSAIAALPRSTLIELPGTF